MAIYDFTCDLCSKTFEWWCSMDEIIFHTTQRVVECDSCKSHKVKRVYGYNGVQVNHSLPVYEQIATKHKDGSFTVRPAAKKLSHQERHIPAASVKEFQEANRKYQSKPK